MIKHVLQASMVLLLGVVIAGCATIASGTTQMVSVSTNVDGAELYLDGEKIGTTPFTGALPKNKSTMRVEAEGYRSETLSLAKSIDPLFFGNIIIGGTLGSITDFATGAAYQYAPASYQVELQEAGQSEQAFRAQTATRKFAMIYIDEISRDASAGGGEYLDALVQIMSEYGGADVGAADVVEALETSRGHTVLFGHEVVELL